MNKQSAHLVVCLSDNVSKCKAAGGSKLVFLFFSIVFPFSVLESYLSLHFFSSDFICPFFIIFIIDIVANLFPKKVPGCNVSLIKNLNIYI